MTPATRALALALVSAVEVRDRRRQPSGTIIPFDTTKDDRAVSVLAADLKAALRDEPLPGCAKPYSPWGKGA